MSRYNFIDRIDPILVGQDSRINFYIRNKSTNEVRDYTGATVSVLFVPQVTGANIVLAGALSVDPTIEPQAYVNVEDTTFVGYTTPQDILCYVTITLSDGKKDKSRFVFSLQPGS